MLALIGGYRARGEAGSAAASGKTVVHVDAGGYEYGMLKRAIVDDRLCAPFVDGFVINWTHHAKVDEHIYKPADNAIVRERDFGKEFRACCATLGIFLGSIFPEIWICHQDRSKSTDHNKQGMSNFG